MARTQGNGGEGSAIEMLVQDHKRVQKLFKDFEKVDRDDDEAVREVVETACLEVQIHSMLEEEIFYPAVRTVEGATEDFLNESEIEHEAADDLIARLHELEPDDPMYCAYFAVLAKFIKHHLKEEEHTLFPRVEKMKLDLKQLGEEMRARREELFAEMERAEEEGEESDEEEVNELSAQPGEVPTPEPEDEELEDEQEQIDISRTRH